ncbi:MAG: hypothetical protein ACSLFB_00240 [Acidimicrobiales bacterium]
MPIARSNRLAREGTVMAAEVAELGRPRRVTISGSVTLRSTMAAGATRGFGCELVCTA